MTSVEIPISIATALPTLSVFDITHEVSREVAGCGVKDGIAFVAPAAPRALIRVTERESGFFCDFEELLARLVPMDLRERERLITLLLGPQNEGVPFAEGRLCLGTWQRILLFGFNGDARAAWSVTTLG